MKTRRNIYIIIGSILIIVNLLTDISEYNGYSNDVYNIGYLFGSNFLLIFGLVLLGFAYKLQKKIKRMKENEIEESITNIGNAQSSKQ